MHLEHFDKTEFRGWYDHLSPRLLTLLDVLRHRLGSPVYLSIHPKAIGRKNGPDDESAHNIDYWGEVLAVDFFVSGIYHRAQAEDVVNTMRELGFTGIGVYSDTNNNAGKKQVMFHGDVRPNEKMGSPATWGRVKDKYTSLLTALASLDTKP